MRPLVTRLHRDKWRAADDQIAGSCAAAWPPDLRMIGECADLCRDGVTRRDRCQWVVLTDGIYWCITVIHRPEQPDGLQAPVPGRDFRRDARFSVHGRVASSFDTQAARGASASCMARSA